MPAFPLDFPADKPNAGGAALEAGFAMSERDGQWVIDTDDEAVAAACQAWLDAFDAKAAALAERVPQVKAEASARIEALVGPVWKQQNATARRIELLGIPLVRGRELTTAEVAEAALIDAAWAAVVAIRAASNQIEADLAALPDAAAIFAFDIPASERWP